MTILAITDSSVVARVLEAIQGVKLLLDHARAGEATEHIRAAGLVVGAAGARATEGLLPDEGGGCLAVCYS